MHRRWLAGIALLASASALARAARAQDPVFTAPRVGAIAALNLAHVAGGQIPNVANALGFGGGVFLTVPIDPQFGVQPELLFTMKGTKSGATPGSLATIKLSYVEIPLLARVEFKTWSAVTTQFALGPAFSIKTGCSLDLPEGSTVAADCNEVTNGTYSSYDFGAIIGGGFAIGTGAQRLLLGVRYDLGLRKIVTDSQAKNRVLSFVGGFEYSFPRE